MELATPYYKHFYQRFPFTVCSRFRFDSDTHHVVYSALILTYS